MVNKTSKSRKPVAQEASWARGKWLLGAGGIACVAGVMWLLWPAKTGDAVSSPMVPKVLCSSCGFIADAAKVNLDGQAARAPAMGPGYKCPNCQKRTLYPNPYICKKCKTPFLISRNASGEFSAKCPKCGTVN